MAMTIDESQCTACAMCESECPTDSILEKNGTYTIDAASCNECEGLEDGPQCVNSCPVDDCIIRA